METENDNQDFSTSVGGTYIKNTEITVKAEANPGYEFVAWRITTPENPEATLSTDATHTFKLENDLQLFAVFRAIPTEYTVVYDGNDASGYMADDVVAAGGTYTLKDCGYTTPYGTKFVGWAIGGLGGEQKQPGEQITVTEETNIYAVWEDITYTVSFNANGGAGSMLDETEQLGGYVLPECTFTAPTGKQFKCWAKGSASGQQYDVGYEYDVTANVTFYAVWENVPAQHVHNHGSEWKTDAENHWNECECGDKANVAAHTDENTDGKCDVCEYVISNGEVTEIPEGNTGNNESENTDGSADNDGNNDSKDSNGEADSEKSENEEENDADAEKKSGCGSYVSMSVFAIIGILGVAFGTKKKKLY